MDAIGQLFRDEKFSDLWSKYRNGTVEFFNNVPFLYAPKKHNKVLRVYANSCYDKNVFFHAVERSLEKKLPLMIWTSNDPLEIDYSKHSVEYTMSINLSKSIDEIFSSFKKSTKQRIEKAMSHSLKVRIADDIYEFDKWWNENYLKWAKKKYFTAEKYEFIRSIYEQKDLTKLFLAYFDNKIIAGLLVIFSPDKIGYIWIATDDIRYINKYPNHLLQFEVIKWLKNNNYKSCDLGTLKYSKIFKEGFAGKVSMNHVYEFQFDPIIARLVLFCYEFRKKVLRRY